MNPCAICGKSGDGKLCENCGYMLGLFDGQHARRALPCARCQHTELVRALVRELTIHPASESNVSMTAARAVTYAPRFNKGVFGGKVKGVHGPDERTPFGILELYVCTKCGFSEWYARDPASIPIGPEYGTEKIVAK
jgi:predicted nucleic-acid-binding Zn-ribbon protein